MPVTKGALLHQLVQRIEQLEARVAQLEEPPTPAKKAAPKRAEK